MSNQVIAEPIDCAMGYDKATQDELDRLGRMSGRWFKEGKKDGLCGVRKAPQDIPKGAKDFYKMGLSYGKVMREAA